MNRLKCFACAIVLCAVAECRGEDASPQGATASLRNVAQQWADAFAAVGVSRSELERQLGHSVESLTESETWQLRRQLEQLQRGTRSGNESGVSLAARESDLAPLSPTSAAKLAQDVDGSQAQFLALLNEVDAAVKTLPTGTPDLQKEAFLVGKYLEMVRALRPTAAEFNRRAPEMIEAASRYRSMLRTAIDALAAGAQRDRTQSANGFQDLATAEEITSQAYEARLSWADDMYREIHGKVGEVKLTLQFLDRWEAVLLLMEPVAKQGAIAQADRDKLLRYLKQVDDAIKSFKAFSQKVREANQKKSAAPPSAELHRTAQSP
jgi:hypothetical protein